MQNSISLNTFLCFILLTFSSGLFSNLQATNSPDYLLSIPCTSDFDALKGHPNTAKFGQTESVKVVYDLNEDKIYFIQSEKFKFHFRFCKEVLGYEKNNYSFNMRNYTQTHNRDFLLATLNNHKNGAEYTLEFSVGDEISPEQVEDLYCKLIPLTIAGKNLKVFLNTQKKIEAFDGFRDRLPTITADDLFKQQVYQPLNAKTSVGFLKFCEAEKMDDANIHPGDIIILKGTPNELTLCAGVICNQFQTPLSHINILCQNRGTPIMALKHAWNNEAFRQMEGQLVKFSVSRDTFSLLPASPEMAAKFNETHLPKETLFLDADFKRKGIMSMDQLTHANVNLVGGKAANFGELSKIKLPNGENLTTPEGAFAIPFYYYQQHLQAHKIDFIIADLLADSAYKNHPEELKAALKAIQKEIKKAPLDSTFLSMIEDKIRAESPSGRMRFRSSTNAEDIEGFNGAGLYTSETGILDHNKKTIEKAIKKVWASVWNYRAFQEREYFGIDHSTVAMGILAHRSFPHENSNGVAITRNLYRDGYAGFVINVQQGETSVVSAPEGVSCDQLICYSDSKYDFFTKKDIVEYISNSSISEGQPVLSTAQVVNLTQQLSAIKKHYYELKTPDCKYNDFAMDVEFKFDGEENVLYIKQARPFK